ncbi:Ig-like domain-containing protein, partial [Archangium gephyra]
SGTVLVSGGWNSSSAPLNNAEVYDPATGAWSPTAPLTTARGNHTATLLPSGRVLVSGGGSITGSLASAELYDDTRALQMWRPDITPPATQQRAQKLRITGSRLRGLSEASSGNTQSSATNFPLVGLFALEGGAMTRVTALDSFSDTEVNVQTPNVPNGYYILSVMANALHGGQMVRVDGPHLAAPKVTAPAEGAFINNPKPAIHGTAEARNTVRVWLDGAMAGTTETAEDGKWMIELTTPLTSGNHQVTAIATDAVANVSPSSEPRNFTVDMDAPEMPKVTAPAEGAFVNNPRPAIRGTAELGSTVTVWLDGAMAGTTTRTDPQGNWSFTPSTALTEGRHQAQATAMDEAGNVSPQSEPSDFTVDTEAPAPPRVTAPEDGSFISNPKPTLGGLAEAGSTVTVWLDGKEIPGTDIVVDEEGNWSFVLTTALGPGHHEVKARATDAIGNISQLSEEYSFFLKKSHYGWSCTTAPASPASWALLALVLSLGRRRLRPPHSRSRP